MDDGLRDGEVEGSAICAVIFSRATGEGGRFSRCFEGLFDGLYGFFGGVAVRGGGLVRRVTAGGL